MYIYDRVPLLCLQMMMSDLVPLCSNQYQLNFNTTRLPHKEHGKLRNLMLSQGGQLQLIVVILKFQFSFAIYFHSQMNFSTKIIQITLLCITKADFLN